jgi:hypothetical protein
MVPPKAVAARLNIPDVSARVEIDPNVMLLRAALTEIVIVFVTPER